MEILAILLFFAKRDKNVVFEAFLTYLTPQITFLSETLEANQFVLLRAFRRVPICIFEVNITQPLPKKGNN